jgi:pyridoxamine 5'-phosphate oxidase
VSADPLEQLRDWYAAARDAGVPEPEAAALATATADGRPSVRIVLLRGFDADGVAFYTNYESRKGRELAENPRAALVFHWAQEPRRQVLLTGRVERLSGEESDEYWATRPAGSRLAAWASKQSLPLPDRGALESAYEEAEQAHGDDPPRPPYWGGFLLVPDTVEFWESRPSRLHDRVRFTRAADGWKREILAP